jgi:hypothetical protein
MKADQLAEEQAYFEKIRKSLLAESEDKFVLIKGQQKLGVFDTGEAAYEFGLAKLGNVPMLIAQVQKEDVVARFPALQLGLIHAAIQD